MCVIVGKPLDITPQIYQTQPVEAIKTVTVKIKSTVKKLNC